MAKLYRSYDALATAPTQLTIGSGTVSAVWVHELSTDRVWAGLADGKVYFSADRGDTWTLQGTIPEGPIIEIRESYGALGTLSATAGAGYYQSFDSGATWTRFDSGDTAWRMAGGWGQNAYSFLNDDVPLRFEDGHSITLPSLTPAVRHIRALTFGWQDKILYAADDQARLFASNDDFTSLSYVADAPSGVNHMIRSGNIRGVIYLACDDGIVKWIPDANNAMFYIRRTADPVAMVGYGPAHALAGAYDLLLIPQGASGADDVIRRSSAGIWSNITPPMSGWYWTGIAVNPFNQSEWLLWGTDNSSHWSYRNSSNTQTHGDGYIGTHSPLWHTDDEGATWTEIPLTQDGGMEGGVPGSDPMYADRSFCAWDQTTNGRWALVMNTNAFGNDGWLWIGNGTTAANALFFDDVVLSTIASAPAGEWISTKFNGPERPLSRISATGTRSDLTEATTVSGGNAFVWHAAVDLLPSGSRGIVGLRENTANGWGVSDYLSGLVDAHFAVSGNPATITAASHGVYVANDGGIVSVTDPFGAGTTATVAGSGTAFSYIRAGRRFRRAVAALAADKSTVVATGDGVSWQTIPLPSTWDLTKLAPMLEVIERGT